MGSRVGLRRTRHQLRRIKARAEMKEMKDRDRAGRSGSADRGSYGSQVDCSWEHRRRSSASRLLIRPSSTREC
jgi:hypothetical protein